MTSKDIRKSYVNFFINRGHQEIAAAKLVSENDPTTLFTSSGMQPLIPYLLGQAHPDGKRLVNSQPSFRAGDIEEVGDNRHTTFFEMLGNWSLGDYFKKEQLPWIFEFVSKELGLDEKRIHVSVFEGNDSISRDTESEEIWKSLGLPKGRIHFYDVRKNWWSKSGTPDQMPVGEIGGTCSEIFYEFPQMVHNPQFGDKCHPNCDCGRFLEIGNSVFIEYKKVGDGEFEKLSQKNVDFGGGLERLTAATNDSPDIFEIDLFQDIAKVVEQITGKNYSEDKTSFRVITDHLRAATFIILDGIIPSNKLQGYILRRLLRRSAIKLRDLSGQIKDLSKVAVQVLAVFDGLFGIDKKSQTELINKVINNEMNQFGKTLEKGLKEIEKITEISGKKAFDLYQTYGFPYEVTEEIFRTKGQDIDREQYRTEFEKHRELSRTASVGMFKGGLGGHSPTEIKYHTATHLLHQALRDVLGPEVFQKGSNINEDRLRFDFSFNRKMTEGEIKKAEEIINERIKQDLTVDRHFMSLPAAQKMNAIGLFIGKYEKEVSIYAIGPNFKLDSDAKDQRDRGSYYSAEFCGGPHVEHTGVIGKVKITKEEAISAGVRRIRAEIVLN